MPLVLWLILLSPTAFGETYQKPPAPILTVLNAPATPIPFVNPSRTHVLLAAPRRYPPIADVAQPMLRLAGTRINPRTNGPHLPFATVVGLTLKRLDSGADVPLTLPAEAQLSPPLWSPDGGRFAVTHTRPDGIELWLGETASGRLRRIDGVVVNAAFGETMQWMPDSRSLLVQSIPPGRGAPPQAVAIPSGPNAQQSKGRNAPVRTYQDLLNTPHDEDLFDYYASAQLLTVDVGTGKSSPYGKPAIYRSLDPSPDGGHVLVTRVHRPYSYLLPADDFPHDIEVWDRSARLVKQVASLPLADAVPIEGVPTGPRGVSWRPDQPATIFWVEALDGGNPKEKVPHRDRMMAWKAPFSGEPAEIFKTEHRMFSAAWTAGGGFALVRDYEREKRWVRTFLVDADHPQQAARTLWSRSIQERYRSEGTVVERVLPNGQRAVAMAGDEILLRGEGATPKGDRPFLDRFNLKTGQSTRLFRSDEKSYEVVAAALDDSGSRFLTLRESPTEPPNFFIRSADGKSIALTHFTDPAPQLRGITTQLVTYQRADGVPLSFTLYLPPNYKPGTRLPTVVWAYPREFTDPDTAGQVAGSAQRFTTIAGPSHLFFLLQGYAILDNAAMPVVGPPETVNNTYVEQIVASAKAAIDKAAEMGVTDPARVGVGGHSYGAFMTANLLAHSDLFKAGIARSGAYNRTLTPFGFQSERRTIWEAPEIYLKMSPFMVAHKIKTPILLLHGEADNNPGTFPIQSERMYQAIRGNGGIVRYVTLPHESHGYAARESIEHTLYEMISWFDRYVKNAGGAGTN